MAQPSVAITRLDLSLSYAEFSLRANRKKFGGLKILPALAVGVLSQSDFPRINLASLLKAVSQSDERAPYGTYPRDTFTWDKDSFGLKDHGNEETVDDELIQMYSGIIAAEMIATERGIDRLLRRLETDIANTLFTSSWAHKTNISVPWSTHATAIPIDDINAAIGVIEDRTGVTPNKLVITDKTWRDLKSCEQFEDKLNSGSNDMPDNISQAGFLSLFDELDEIVIVGGFTNNANQGQAASLARVWDSSMAMLTVSSNGQLDDNDLTSVEPHLGRTLFHQPEAGAAVAGMDGEQSIIIEEYREEARRGGVIRSRNHRQIKLLQPACAQLLTNVKA